MKYISELFDPEPEQWGLRGDPYLWDELKAHFVGKPFPNAVNELETELLSAIFTLTSVNLRTHDETFIEKYAHGGMSSGHISHDFWLDKALPMLKNRLEKRKKHFNIL